MQLQRVSSSYKYATNTKFYNSLIKHWSVSDCTIREVVHMQPELITGTLVSHWCIN